MGYYSVWPYLAGMVTILLLASTPLLKWADTPPTTVPARVYTIDGLRGFLALGVVFHHGAIWHQYLMTGIWALPPSRFYTDLGQTGVAIFFMITGYLFWTQMLQANGRPNFPKLYIGRIFRIVPLYTFLTLVMLLIVGILTGWRLQESPFDLVKQVAPWLAGGILPGEIVNGFADTKRVAGGTTWTLHYEWVFYLSLAVTSIFARVFILGAFLPVMGLLVAAPLLWLYPDNLSLAVVLMFSIGMTTASARRALTAKMTNLPQWVLSTGIVGCLALMLLSFDGVYATPPILILGIAFAALVICGGTVYGLLLTLPAKRLGDISYGIYLLQGPIFFLTFASPAIRSFATRSVLDHWTVVTTGAVLLVMVANLTHVLIERPGIKAGQRVWATVKSRFMRNPDRDEIAKPSVDSVGA